MSLCHGSFIHVKPYPALFEFRLLEFSTLDDFLLAPGMIFIYLFIFLLFSHSPEATNVPTAIGAVEP